MMGVIDIRGTHGSGKSYIVHTLLSAHCNEPIEEDGEHLGYLITGFDAAVLGRYANVCGGCDGIKTADEVVRRVRLFSKSHRHVVLEGILVSHTFSRYHSLAEEMAGYGYTFAFLNTPLRTCLTRIKTRRRKVGNMKPLNPDNAVRDYHRIWERLRVQVEDAGHRTVVLDYRNPMTGVIRLLEEG